LLDDSILESVPAAGKEDRQAIQQALASLDAGQTPVWPTSAWRWQRYDDAFRISMLFRL
jgi:hypothetical protein